MATSNVQVCNYALTLLGANNITALDESSEEARKCSALFDLVRDKVLVAHPWNFAIARVNLGLLADAPESDYDYKFQLPNGCLRVLSTNLPEGDSYKIEGRELLCDASSIIIKYIDQLTDVSKWSPQFVTAIGSALAAALAYPLTGSRTIEADMNALYERELKQAIGLDSAEGTPDELLQDDWLTGRY